MLKEISRVAVPSPIEQHDIEMGRDRKLIIWSNRAKPSSIESRGVILLAPGFVRKMTHLSHLALYLTQAGFDVYRYDPINHVGLSSGTVREFLMTSGLESMESAISWLKEIQGHSRVGIVATSLSARLAYRLVGKNDQDVDFLITGVGVVNLQVSLTEIFGEDYLSFLEEDLPEYVKFENNEIRAASFVRDCHINNWATIKSTIHDIRSASVPICSISGTDDLWVKYGDVEKALRFASHKDSMLISAVGGKHDVALNPSLARLFLLELTRMAIRLSEKTGGRETDYTEPSYQHLLAQSLYEKRLYRTKLKELEK